MKKKYYGILLAAVIAAGTMGVTAQMLLYRNRVMNWKCHWY